VSAVLDSLRGAAVWCKARDPDLVRDSSPPPLRQLCTATRPSLFRGPGAFSIGPLRSSPPTVASMESFLSASTQRVRSLYAGSGGTVDHVVRSVWRDHVAGTLTKPFTLFDVDMPVVCSPPMTACPGTRTRSSTSRPRPRTGGGVDGLSHGGPGPLLVRHDPQRVFERSRGSSRLPRKGGSGPPRAKRAFQPRLWRRLWRRCERPLYRCPPSASRRDRLHPFKLAPRRPHVFRDASQRVLARVVCRGPGRVHGIDASPGARSSGSRGTASSGAGRWTSTATFSPSSRRPRRRRRPPRALPRRRGPPRGLLASERRRPVGASGQSGSGCAEGQTRTSRDRTFASLSRRSCLLLCRPGLRRRWLVACQRRRR
jgi:hypothetical protein